jgi:hypothetical protein
MSPLMRLDQIQSFAAINVLRDPGYHPGHKVIPNTAQVVINWTLTDAKIAHNVLYANYTGTPAFSNTVAQAIFSAITSGAQWTALAAFLAPTTALRSVSILDIRTTTGVLFTSTGTAVPGTSTGTAMPDEIALAVRLSTAERGPSGRGRYYVPGWATNSIGTSGTVAAAAVSALQSWAQIAVSGALNTNIGPQVLGLPERNAYTSPITGADFDHRDAHNVALTSITVPDNHWDSQRRRGLK